MRGITSLILFVALALLLAACGPTAPTPTPIPTVDPEREAILAFTREALEIEAQRSELVAWFATIEPTTLRFFVRLFLPGVPEGYYHDRGWGPAKDLEGMSALYRRILLLDSPQSMQAIKDSLNHIYDSEIEHGGLIPEVTKDNLDYWKAKAAEYPPYSTTYNYYMARVDSSWGQLQALRRDVYTRWAQLLREHGIDPAKEGLTGLFPQPTPILD